jgi:hypothetical protein
VNEDPEQTGYPDEGIDERQQHGGAC